MICSGEVGSEDVKMWKYENVKMWECEKVDHQR